jgi:hypothetical protein
VSESELIITAAHLTYPTASGRMSDRYSGTYEYTADHFDNVVGSFLFWGPYLDLGAGVYVLDFIGEVAGRLSLEFLHDAGKIRIKRIDIGEFAAPACVVLVRSVHAFEIRALKTQPLERLRLDAIRLQCVYHAGAAA